MELINGQIQQYAEKYTSKQDPFISALEKDTLANNPHANMLSGHLQGVVLEMISYMLKPRRVLEIGTFTGFSALCLAKGLVPGGELHTIELRPEDAERCKKTFLKAGAANIIQHTGDARDIIPTLDEQWDLVFIDADKVSYIDYYELTLPSLKSGGFILADNVFFHGDVLGEPLKGKNAVAIHAFNEHVAKDDRTEQVLTTIRDGLMIIRKK